MEKLDFMCIRVDTFLPTAMKFSNTCGEVCSPPSKGAGSQRLEKLFWNPIPTTIQFDPERPNLAW